ncbi:MAG: LemA family protein [Desulfuromonas sp.]|nr:MAG: LemA family protein [Desulfuromonas sp.]
MIGWIVFGVCVLILVILLTYAIVLYNGFVQMKNDVDKTWSNIDILLKQRFDELPKLIKVCEGYMQHEKRTLEAVIQARSALQGAKSPEQKMQAQNMLTDTLRSLFAVVERYPELKADAGFRRLGERISEIEEMIADRRELYNEYVNLFNVRIDQFPDVIIARLFNFTSRQLWTIDPAHRADVEVNFNQL